MSKLTEWINWMWLEAQLAAPPIAQQTIIPRLHEAKDFARLLLKPYLSVHQWQGRGQGGSLVVNYAGLAYASSFLKSLLFEEEPEESQIDRMPAWSLSKRVDSLTGDLIIVETDKHLIRKLPRHRAISLPSRIHHIVGVRGNWDDLWHSFGKSARKQDVRLIRKYGFECELSQSEKDFEMFYHTMYVPTTKARHGELASISSIEKYHQFFRHGFLLLIKQGGDVISGGLCSVQHNTINLAATGVINADWELTQKGAVASIYFFVIHWAHNEGYRSVNLGACWPFLSDGGFQFKRKWGATVVVPSREHKQIWLRIQRDTPAVRQFLKDNPFVVVDDNGELHGLVITDNHTNDTTQLKAELKKTYATPGLSDLLVRSMADLLNELPDGTSND